VERERSKTGIRTRLTAWTLALGIVSPFLAGCGRNDTGVSYTPPVQERTQGSRSEYPPPQERNQGLSTRQKVAILAGAAALYYLYNKHKQRQGAGSQGQYYLSKNGRVYYRDQNGNPVWVTPPREGIQVPASEAEEYSRYRGYNGRTNGEEFGGYGAGAEPVAGMGR
jgi:hypothetical protein